MLDTHYWIQLISLTFDRSVFTLLKSLPLYQNSEVIVRVKDNSFIL